MSGNLNKPFKIPWKKGEEPKQYEKLGMHDVKVTTTLYELFDRKDTDFRRRAKVLADIIMHQWPERADAILITLEFSFSGSSKGHFIDKSGPIIRGPNALEKLISFFEEILKRLLDNYEGYETFNNFPHINKIGLELFNLAPLRGMENRYVFGQKEIKVKDYLKFCYFSKSKIYSLQWLELKQFLQATGYGLWIPYGLTVCIKQCLYMINNYKKFKEENLYKAQTYAEQQRINNASKSYTSRFFDTIVYGVDANGKKTRKVYKHIDNKRHRTRFESMESWRKVVNEKITRFKGKDEMLVFDWHLNKKELEEKFKFEKTQDPKTGGWIFTRFINKEQMDKKIIILIILNHACLLIPDHYNLWIKQIEEEFTQTDYYIPIGKCYLYDKTSFLSNFEFLTFDIETRIDKNKEQIAFMVGLYSKRGENYVYHEFLNSKEKTCIERFLDEVRLIASDAVLHYEKPKHIYLFAHNGGKFDFYLVLQYLIHQCWRIEKTVTKSNRFYGIKIWPNDIQKDGKRIFLELRDSYTLIPFSLENAAKAFNVKTKKLEVDVDWKAINEENEIEYSEKLSEYLNADCVSLFEVLETFNRLLLEKVTFEANNFQFYSLPSISKKTFLKNFYLQKSDEYSIYDLKGFTYNYIKNAYYGGRTQARYKEEIFAPIYPYDFKSLYPSVMRKPLPVGRPEFVKFDENYLGDPSDFFGFIRVKLKLKFIYQDSHFPTIPVRGKDGLYFPKINDWIEVYIFSEELKFVEKFYEIQYLDGFEFKTSCLYKPVIEFLYRLKEQAEKDNNLALRTLMKILLNSGYGAWGLKHVAHPKISISVMKDISCFVEHQCWNDEFLKYFLSGLYINHFTYQVDDLECPRKNEVTLWFHKSIEEPKDTNVALAAAITAYARIELHKLIYKILDHNGKIYYMDTDSVYTNLKIEDDPDFKEYFNGGSTILGNLDDEAKNDPIEKMVLIASKLYAYSCKSGKEVVKAKGFLKSKFKEIEYDNSNFRIVFKEPSKYGTNELTYEHIRLMLEGWTIYQQRGEFLVSINNFLNLFDTVKVREKSINFTGINHRMVIDENLKPRDLKITDLLSKLETQTYTEDLIKNENNAIEMEMNLLENSNRDDSVFVQDAFDFLNDELDPFFN